MPLRTAFPLFACILLLTALSCPGREKPPGESPSHRALLAPQIPDPSPPGLALRPPGMTYPILGFLGEGTSYCHPQATPNDCQSSSLPLWEHWRGIYHHLAMVGTLMLLGWGSALWNLWCQVNVVLAVAILIFPQTPKNKQALAPRGKIKMPQITVLDIK